MVLLTPEQLALFNSRDHNIFDLVFRHYSGHIKLYAYKILKNEKVAEDITIEVFMELLKPSPPFNTEENIKVWLFLRTENRCLFWELEEKQKALTKKWMEQSKDLDNMDPQLQHHMKVINAVIRILNKLPQKYEQDAPLPDCDPVIYWDFANRLKRVLVNGDAMPEGDRDVAELASLFAENRSWLEQVCDGAWLQEQSIIYKNIDPDERWKTLWTMVAEESTPPVQATPFYPKPVTGKLLTMGSYVRAASFIAVLAGACCLLIPGKKTNPTAANNVQQQAADNSTRQRNVYKTTPIDSFSSSGLYMQMSTDEADNDPLFHKLLIPDGGFMEVPLPDGSRAWLNSTTTFVYPHAFTGNKRKVEITGEAYFEVESNAAMPFLVIVNGVQIETRGGRFHVKAYKEEAGKRVTVLEGAVRVAVGPNDVLIKANQSALVEQKKRIAIKLNEDTAKAIAWKDRRFLFMDDSLAVVARELARRYSLVLTGNINSDALVFYSGSRLEPIETVLKNMQLGNENLHFKLAGRVLTIE